MNLIFEIFNVVQQIMVWGSLVFALAFFAIMFRKVVARKAGVKDWAVLIIALAYGILFIIFKIFYNDTFEMVTSVIFLIVVIISAQFAKYEDRKAGKRWWRD